MVFGLISVIWIGLVFIWLVILVYLGAYMQASVRMNRQETAVFAFGVTLKVVAAVILLKILLGGV